MSDIPFIVLITKPNKHRIETKLVTETCKDIESIKNKIIYIMQEELSTIDDLPDDYDKFISEKWYHEISADAEPFEYKIFDNNKWVTPWSIEELYDMTLDILHKLNLLTSYIDNANNEDENEGQIQQD